MEGQPRVLRSWTMLRDEWRSSASGRWSASQEHFGDERESARIFREAEPFSLRSARPRTARQRGCKQPGTCKPEMTIKIDSEIQKVFGGGPIARTLREFFFRIVI